MTAMTHAASAGDRRAPTGGDADFFAMMTPAGLCRTLLQFSAFGESVGRAPGGADGVGEPLPEGARFETQSYQGEAGELDYKLYIPSGRDGERLPLVVMLHGCRQSPDDFAAGTRMNSLAEELGLLVAWPAQSAAASQRRCWNWFDPRHQVRDQGEPALVAGVVRQILDAHPVDASRVYVAGLSAGGAAALVLSGAYPDLFAAVGVHSGLAAGSATGVLTALAAMRQAPVSKARGAAPMPTIIFHGDQDRTVHVSNGGEVLAQLTADAGALDRVDAQGLTRAGQAWTRATYMDAEGDSLCENWTLHGAGHAWAGGDPSGSYTDSEGPDASREMLRFFLERRSGAAASG